MNRTKKQGAGCAVLFILPFVLIGAAIFVGMGLRPMWQAQAAQRWIEVPCTIEYVELKSSRDSDGDTTYRIDVLYRYRYDGTDYISDRYDFSFGSTNVGVDGMREAVSALNKQKSRVCWVDPQDPTSAVLERRMGSFAWFGLIFGAVFAGLPLLAMIFIVRGAARARRRAALGERDPLSVGPTARKTPAVVPVPGDGGPIRLAARGNTVGGVVALAVFAAFWNGLSWFMFTQVDDTVARVFIGIFLVIGAVLALAFLHQFLALFNPVPAFELDRGLLRPGSSNVLRWTWHGNARRILKLEIRLVGREEADYRRGTDNRTDRHEFFNELIYESMEAELTGTAPLRIPTTAIPTLQAAHNRVIWAIHVKGDIPRFPDVNREFALAVLSPENGPLPEGHEAPVSDAIHLKTGRTVYRPGDSVAGSLRWELGEARKRLALRLFWYTAGIGTVDVGVVDEWVLETPDLQGEQVFSLRVPEAVPVSMASKLVAVLWALELVAEPGGALERIELTVAPRGEVLRAP